MVFCFVLNTMMLTTNDTTFTFSTILNLTLKLNDEQNTLIEIKTDVDDSDTGRRAQLLLLL